MTERDKKEKRRRAAIASIMRRRNRSRKPRANSGASETSWAEYGPVTFTPGSDRSWAQKLGLFVLMIVGLSIPFILFFGSFTNWLDNALEWASYQHAGLMESTIKGGVTGWIFSIFLYAVLVLSAVAIVFVSVLSLVRIIKNNIKSD